MKKQNPNALIRESSPYLLQHAYNPVAWEAWRPEVLEKAARENKLILVSIGYAACHWCHVMEKECFEDQDVADVMNRHFIPIKIDREERPDIDHIYMDALQLMTGGGGWPLNVVALPDGRPFWGATYVRKADWIQALEQLAGLYESEPQKVMGYAENLAQGIRSVNIIPHRQDKDLMSENLLARLVSQWSAAFDTYLGGYKRAPKFMMPVNLNFLLHYAYSRGDKAIMDYVHTTLTKMAYGGVFDHLAGGFSRYSTDVKWHVPHFEKMLYDNAQLISLYARAYAASGNPFYKEVADQCIQFVRQELMAPDHGFYASLDADSLTPGGELKEGAYYVWKEEELRKLLGGHFAVFRDYYNINSYGHWEDGNYVLIRDSPGQEVAEAHGLGLQELGELLNHCRDILTEARKERKRPRLDDKVLASWNGLMLQALTDAYRYLGDKRYLELALRTATFIKSAFMEVGGMLYHNKAGKGNRITGYLEDYSSIMEAFLSMYELTFDESWLETCRTLADHCMEHYYDQDSHLFYFTSAEEPYVVRRTLETTDNVIPASNSIMAKNLFRLSKYFPEANYGEVSRQMLVNMQENMEKNPQNHANWLQLLLCHLHPFYEVAIMGPAYRKQADVLLKKYLPQILLAGAEKESGLALLQGRYVPEKTLVYVCTDGSCLLPADSAEAAVKQLSPPIP